MLIKNELTIKTDSNFMHDVKILLNQTDLKILKFIFNFKFEQMNIWNDVENNRRGDYIKHAELSFHKYE